MNVFKFVEVGGVTHYRGSHPKTPEDIERLRSLGVKMILNLRTFPYDPIESREAGERGIYLNVSSMSYFTPPSSQHLKQAVDFIVDNTAKGMSVFIHCHSGVDRTGAVVAAYRALEQHWPVEAALGEMKLMGFHRRYFWWVPLLRSRISFLCH